MEEITIVLVEPHRFHAQGLRQELDQFSGMRVLDVVQTGTAAIKSITKAQPDIVLSEIELPDISGLHLIDMARPESTVSPPRFIFLTSDRSERGVQQAMVHGADGYILKANTTVDVADAIRRVMNGEPVMCPESLRALINAARRRSRARGNQVQPHDKMLTKREIEILGLFGSYSAQEIAERLGLEGSTVKSHKQHIFRKLGVTSQAAALREAMNQGLI